MHYVRSLLVLCFVCLPTWAQATRYWVATTGSDANACSAIDGDADPGVYRLTPLQGAACLTVAGDRLTIKTGVYTGSGARIYEPTISVANGTAGNPTIIEGEGAEGCALLSNCLTVLRPNGAPGNNLEDPSYITIRRIEFDYTNMGSDGCSRLGGTGTTVTFEDVHMHHCQGDGMLASALVPFFTMRRVHIHHAGLLDTNGANPSHGVYLNGDDVLIEYSRIRDCGPLNGDHNNNGAVQIYNSSASSDGRADRAIIRYNEFYACDYGVIVEGNDGQVYGNVLHDFLSDGINFGHDGAMRPIVHSNLVYNAAGNALYIGIFTSSADDGSIANNHFAGNGVNTPVLGAGVTGTVQTTNRYGGVITDCVVSTSNFRQKVGSLCIDAGTGASTRLTFSGTAPDIGPFESFTATSASVVDNILDVVVDLLAFMPVLPATGMTGWSVNNSRTVTSAVALSGSTVRLTFDGAVCVPSETWTVSYTPGNVTDSSLIGNTLNQPLFGVTNLAVTNACLSGQPQAPSLIGPRRNPFLFR
jgi:hypothetical protein